MDEFMIQHFIFYVLSVIKDYLGARPFMAIFGTIGIETVEWNVVFLNLKMYPVFSIKIKMTFSCVKL